MFSEGLDRGTSVTFRMRMSKYSEDAKSSSSSQSSTGHKKEEAEAEAGIESEKIVDEESLKVIDFRVEEDQ